MSLPPPAGVMGLAERRSKQVIPRDPRNLHWAQDADGVGARMMRRLGWTPGTGLGARASGSVDAVSAPGAQAQTRGGLGAERVSASAAAAEDSYQQMLAFQAVLAKLNATVAGSGGARKGDDTQSADAASSDSASESENSDADSSDASSESADSEPEHADAPATKRPRVDASATQRPPQKAQAPRLVHRAKFLRGKAVSSYTPEQLREILG